VEIFPKGQYRETETAVVTSSTRKREFREKKGRNEEKKKVRATGLNTNSSPKSARGDRVGDTEGESGASKT